MDWSGLGITHGPCDNCGKPKRGIMGSSEWRDGMFCSEECGKRFTARVANGMLPDPGPAFSMGGDWGAARNDERIRALRVRVKTLSHRLTAAKKETR